MSVEQWWNDTDRGETGVTTWSKTCPSATLFTTNLTWPDLGSNPGIRGEIYFELYINTQSVPRSKLSVWVIKTGQLMLYREIIAVCSEIDTTHKYTVWAERRI